MSAELAPASVSSPRAGSGRRSLRLEVAFVIVISAIVLVPGIWKYSLVDPWETHYGEVARTMLQDHDFIHTKWVGTSSGGPNDNEGFRSKPVLMFWLMAAGLQTFGVGDNGGYSGEMVQDARTMIGIRLPFILCAIAGLTLMWWMLARLVNRWLAWLALLVVGSTPIFCMIARNGIPDMPMVACTMGAIALFAMALEDGARPIRPLGHLFKKRGAGVIIDARHVVLGLAGAAIAFQAVYFAIYFIKAPHLAIRGPMPSPALWLPALMLLLFGALSRDGWRILRLPFVLAGGVVAAIAGDRAPARRASQSEWRHVFDDVFGVWDRYALDRLIFRITPVALAAAAIAIVWTGRELTLRELWRTTNAIADRVFSLAKITTMRQVYLLASYFLLGVSILAKGPPGFTVVVGVAAFHVILCWQWRDLWEGGFELKRGLLLMSAIAVPWHVGMYLKEGVRFVDEYIFTHIINRAAAGVDSSPGTFEYYASQIGHGMWLWAALLPAALAAAFLRADRETREGRVRFLVALWAIVAVFVFCFVQTKFHHYILPAIPPLGLLVAFYLHDLVARRERVHPVFAALGVGIVLLICRDLMFEPDRWIEMFVFRYDRPWPAAEPWLIDPSDGILALGLAAAFGVAMLGTRFTRLGVALTGGAGLAICIWALQVYMPHAGKHWGMRDSVRAYYEQRTIYGHKRVFFGPGQCVDGLRGPGDTFRFETFVPDTLQVGQPMTLTVQVNKANEERITAATVEALGEVTAVGDHAVTVKLHAGERAKLEQLRADCERRVVDLERQHAAYAAQARQVDLPALAPAARPARPEPLRGRPPIAVVDADRLIAWQLYWRGENFWSGGEIWSWLPEMKTSLVATNNVEFQKYINDRTRAPVGRRYFLITEAGRITSVKSLLPTPRARESYEVIDTSSNKFSLASFYL